MFTGIVEHIGTVLSLTTSPYTLTITDAAKILTDCHIGDSISINGTCLTVTSFDANTFTVGIIPETLRRTNLGELEEGSRVNLERAVGGDVRFGGHYVQGHVDTVAEIISVTPDANALDFRFKIRDPQYAQYIVEKGFVCLDGVSLTVTVAQGDVFGISMISHTQESVTMPLKKVGDFVNVEVDVSGKVIAQQVQVQLEGLLKGVNKDESPLVKLIESIVDKKLREKGL